MYQEILNALKTKFVGVSESILDRVAKKLASTVKTSEEVQTAVDGVTFQQVLESYGDSRATDAQKTAVANYEKKHSLKDGKPVAEPPAEPEEKTAAVPEDAPAYMKGLIESITSLTKKVDAMQGAELNKSRKQKLEEVLAQLPESLRRGYERIDLTTQSDEEFSTLLTEVTTEVGEIAKVQGAKGAVFGKPTVAGSSVQQASTPEASKEEVDAVMSHLNL